MSEPPLEIVRGQPSWRIASNKVEAYLTQTAGHLGPITFDLGGRKVEPLSVAPWHDEVIDDDLPPILRVLRGDFFCMPFGGNESPFDDERHPPHGETANGRWDVGGLTSEVGVRRESTLVARLRLQTRAGQVEKTIFVRDGESVVYQSHRISGVSGPMTFGHHAMVKFPDLEAAGIVSTSPFVFGATAPMPIEVPENRGYSLLEPDAEFTDLGRVPTITGGETDLTRYPARKGYEDLVMLVSGPRKDFAWSAVSIPSEGYVWYALKNPEMLTSTVLWLSNRGRYYHPWNGRHQCVLGIEEVTSYFHYGLAESVAPNSISDRGYATYREFDAAEPLEIRYVMGVVATPTGFSRVVTIEPAGPNAIVIQDDRGATVEAAVDWGFA